MTPRNSSAAATKIFLIGEIALVAILSSICGYAIRREGYVVNFDIITMLTPSGLIANLGFGSNPDLHPFYFRASERAGIWTQPLLAFNVALIVSAAGFWLWRERRR